MAIEEAGKGFGWGCGITVGVIFALVVIPLLGIFLICGGCTAMSGLFFATDEARQQARQNEARFQTQGSDSSVERSIQTDSKRANSIDDDERRRLESVRAEDIAREKRIAEAARAEREAAKAIEEQERLAAEAAKREAERVAAMKIAAEEKRQERLAGNLLRLAKAELDAGKDGAGGYKPEAVARARKDLESLLKDYPKTKAAAEARKLLESLPK